MVCKRSVHPALFEAIAQRGSITSMRSHSKGRGRETGLHVFGLLRQCFYYNQLPLAKEVLILSHFSATTIKKTTFTIPIETVPVYYSRSFNPGQMVRLMTAFMHL